MSFMSSPRAASRIETRTDAPRRAAKRPAPAKSPAKPAETIAHDQPLSADAKRIAAEIERALAKGEKDAISLDAIQALMAAACKHYSARIEAGEEVLPLRARSTVTPTEVMTTASGLLRAVNLAVFELGMWQSWTGR
jgi:hypothetical protein